MANNGHPPQPNGLDQIISLRSRSTMLAELAPSMLQRNKFREKPEMKERVVELVRKNGALRRELAFYRACYEEANNMMEKVAGSVAHLSLLYYYEPANRAKETDIGNEVALDLEDATKEFVRGVSVAQEDWLAFWGANTVVPKWI